MNYSGLQNIVRDPTAVVLICVLLTLQMYWPTSERETDTTVSELVRGFSFCMLILLSELYNSCWMPPELKYHKKFG